MVAVRWYMILDMEEGVLHTHAKPHQRRAHETPESVLRVHPNQK